MRRKRKSRKPLCNAAGDTLWKHIEIKVMVQGKTQKHDFRAPVERGYSEKQIDETRERVVEYLDKRFPYFNFREVQVGPNKFNYIATGLRGQDVGKIHASNAEGSATGTGGADKGTGDHRAGIGTSSGTAPATAASTTAATAAEDAGSHHDPHAAIHPDAAATAARHATETDS
jgi:hypothetical protein